MLANGFSDNALPMVSAARRRPACPRFRGLVSSVFWITSGAEAMKMRLKLAFTDVRSKMWHWYSGLSRPKPPRPGAVTWGVRLENVYVFLRTTFPTCDSRRATIPPRRSIRRRYTAAVIANRCKAWVRRPYDVGKPILQALRRRFDEVARC